MSAACFDVTAVVVWQPKMTSFLVGIPFLNFFFLIFPLTVRTTQLPPSSNETKGENGITSGYYCEFSVFKPSCQPDEVVVMEAGLYGRMNVGTCVRSDLGYVGCSSNVLDILDRRCSGRRSCEVGLPDKQMAKRTPCMAELKVYLEASYRCQKVVTVERSRFCHSGEPYYVKGMSTGFLANTITHSSKCGSPESPWIVQVDPGQTINISVVDFALNKDNKEESVYATIKDVSSTRKTVTLVSGDERWRQVHLSQTNAVEIRVMPIGPSATAAAAAADDATMAAAHFLIHFQVVGCRDVATPDDGWMRRSGDDQLTIGCNKTSHLWRLRCQGNEWVGDTSTPSCTGYDNAWSATLGSVQIGEVTIPHGVSIIIVALVAVFVGLVILTAGMILVRRHYSRQDPGPMGVYRVTSDHPRPLMMGVESYAPTSAAAAGMDCKRLKETDINCQSLCEVDRDGYTHIWERPLPNPQPISKIPDSSSCPSGLVACSRPTSDSNRVTLGAHGNYFIAPHQSIESMNDAKYYQLDAGGSNLSSPS